MLIASRLTLHVVCSANSPPHRGPRTAPNPHAAAMIPRNCGRCRSGMMSVITIEAMTKIPPPPTPWMVRPHSSWRMSLAVQQTIVPRVNMTTENITAAFRPEISEVAPMNGKNTALDRRYDVPVQKVSMAVPLRSRARVFQMFGSASLGLQGC